MLEVQLTGDNETKVFLNGEYLEFTRVNLITAERERISYSLIVKSDNDKHIAKCLFSEIASDINKLYMPDYKQWGSLSFHGISREEDGLKLVYEVPRNLESWKELYSYNEYFQEFNKLSVNTNSQTFSYSDSQYYSDEKDFFRVKPESLELIIGEGIERYANVFFQRDNQVRESLLFKLREDSVLTYFDFPEEVKVPCEQYLLYFVQFLRDLGVGATAEVQHEVGQVLFAVTPTDKEIALDKIRVALEIYMRLPSSPVSDLSVNDEIAIQRLESNIYHLKSQLKLAHAEVLTNERTIQAQQTIINSQQRLVDGLVILESAKTVNPQREKEDKEDLLPGVLAVTKYKGKGFELGLPEILRRLKEFLHRK